MYSQSIKRQSCNTASFSNVNHELSMENLKKVVDKIQKFYSLVESHESQIQTLIKEAKKPLHSINNQSVFYRALIPEDSVINTPFEKFEGFREALIDTVFTSLQEEYNLLEKIRDKINSANEELKKEQIHLENLFRDLRSKNLTDFTSLNPSCPSFEHIIDWSYEIWCYYHSYYLQISQALLSLNYENERTVKTLTVNFKENTELKKHINKIRSFKFTEFRFIIST